MDTEATANVGELLRILWRRVHWIVLSCVLVAGASYAFSSHQTKEYTATSSLAFNNNPLSQQIAGLQAANGNLAAAQASDLESVKIGDTAAETARLLGHGLTDKVVAASLSISGQSESSIVDVSATSSSPSRAAEIANTYTGQFVKEQQRASRQFFKSALADVKKQLAALSPAQRFGTDGLDLEERAQTLRLLTELGYGNVQVGQEALVPTSPSSPKTKRNTLLGAAMGLLLGLGAAFLLDRLDRRIRRPSDLETIYGLPMLGEVPVSAMLARPARRGKEASLPPAEAEAFNLIRARLRFFNVDRDVHTIVIASAAPGEGKTTIARHLAEAAARSGCRVLIVEADLRHPTLARHFDVRSGPGMAGVLIGAVSLEDAIHTVALEELLGETSGGRTVDVLVAGMVLPPNPGELLESRAMDVLLARSRSAYDLVVIDTPPLTAVSDGFPLLTKVDGIIIVGWVGRTRRDAAERLHETLAGSDVPLLGVVANGSKPGTGIYPAPGRSKSPPAGSSANGVSPAEELTIRTET